MGGSLSRQEELFVSLKWAELLDDAVQRDMEVAMDATEDDEVQSDACKKAMQKRNDSGFTLSLVEWQAFLTILENKDVDSMSAAPSQLCSQMTIRQLQCPVVVLMVHACSWWRKAIDTDTFRQRLRSLTDLMQRQRMPAPLAKTEKDSESDDDESSNSDVFHDAVDDDSDAGESGMREGKRKRLIRSVKQGFTKLRGSRGAVVFEEEMRHLIILYNSVVNDHDTPDAAWVMRECANSFDVLASHNSASRGRPVLQVAVRLLLAVFSVVTPTCAFVERGVEQLQSLEQTMTTAKRSGSDSRQRSTTGIGEEGATAGPVATQWLIVRQLETALVRRQYELDAKQCLGSEGRHVFQSMRDIHDARRQIAGGKPLSEMTPKGRWMTARAQYVGQEHIWDSIQTHFLSADVFDIEKPTVIVLFGPSGYGKSEMAKRIASAIHGCPVGELEASGKLVHLHMPSFCTRDSIYSLVDPPAAHIGDGILLSALLKEPDAVVVLDEFEKSTAEAIQNLWLSAFQKNGTLRSLKNASRCVSTVRTTFILTCNIAAGLINSQAERYLASSPEEQRAMRGQYETQCKDTCRKSLSDPFVNRVDYFHPFVPYTRTQREQFVMIQAERLLSVQAAKGRRILVSPRYIMETAGHLQSFHSNAVEEVLRQLIVRMAQHHLSYAVLTVEMRTSAARPVRYVVLPAYEAEIGELAADDSVVAWGAIPGGRESLERWEAMFPKEGATIGTDAETADEANGQQEPQVEPEKQAQSYPPAAPATSVDTSAAPREYSGKHAVERELMLQTELDKQTAKQLELEKEVERLLAKEQEREHETEQAKNRVLVLQTKLEMHTAEKEKLKSENQTMVLSCTDKVREFERELETQTLQKKRLEKEVERLLETELQMKRDTEQVMCTRKQLDEEKEMEQETTKELVKEVDRLRETITLKDKEIAYLKEKVLVLQKALAVVLSVLLCTLIVTSMFIGVKLTLLLAFFTFALMFFVLNIPLSVLVDAVKGLYNFLGPFHSAIVAGGLALWLSSAWQMRGAVPCWS